MTGLCVGSESVDRGLGEQRVTHHGQPHGGLSVPGHDGGVLAVNLESRR